MIFAIPFFFLFTNEIPEFTGVVCNKVRQWGFKVILSRAVHSLSESVVRIMYAMYQPELPVLISGLGFFFFFAETRVAFSVHLSCF